MKIAVLGTGLMGQAMARRLHHFDDPVVVYNRTREKAKPLEELGVQVAGTVQQAVDSSRCILLALTNANAIHEVLFPEDPPCPDLSGRTIFQTGTISPPESMDLEQRIEDSGGNYLEIPVLGSTPEVEKGELTLMVGSDPEQFERWTFFLKRFSREPLYIGPVGKASALKIALNQLIASSTAAFSFSLGLVLRRGIDVELFMKILRQSVLYAPQFDKKLSRMLEREFSAPHFTTGNLLKDVLLMIDEGRGLGLDVSVIEAVRHLVQEAIDRGYGQTDYSSLYNAVHPP